MASVSDLEELLLLAESESWQDRSRAGQGLVAYLGEPVTDGVILRLLMDAKDTAVTVATADALLARADLVSWRMFARGWAAAVEGTSMTNYIDHLYSCLNGAMYVASLDAEKAAALKGVVGQLLGDDDETVRSAAAELRNLVFEGL